MVEYTFSLSVFENFLLVLMRVASFVFVAPFFSLPNVPRRVKVGFSIFVSFIIMSVYHPEEVMAYSNVIGYAVLVLKEVMTGLLIGYAAQICNSIMIFAGNIIDMQIGISMAQEYNPAMRMQSTISGEIYFYMINLMLIVTGMHRYVLRAMIDSFSLFGLGGAAFEWDNLMLAMVAYITDFFIIAFRIMLPVFGAIMITNCILGIMAKVAPQMHMFSIGVQLKIILGFIVLYLTVILLPEVADFIFVQMRKNIVAFIEAMY